MLRRRSSLDIPASSRHHLDLLRWPLVGRFLKWRGARTALQLPLLALAGLIVFDGLFGPPLAPKNVATVTVWLHYRGLVALVLLIAGNLFCMACPFMLPRRGGRWLREHLLGGGRRAPRLLRSKWPAAGLLLLFFYAYEQFSLWASPWLTAWVALGYFLAAFVVDSCFAGATFCKHLCPLGQFNFFGSLVSPFEIKVRDAGVCTACTTKDCIRALPGRNAWTWQRGCELGLFQPAKRGNLDCTFCLDCVHACPHDNVGLLARIPSAELWDDPFRSGIGRFSERSDLAALVIVLVFAAFVNALLMIRPVSTLRLHFAAWLGGSTGLLSDAQEATTVLLLCFVAGLILLPAGLLGLTGSAGSRLARQPHPPVLGVIRRYVYALVPLGFGMWAAHYSFHFLTGGLTIVPVVQSFLADVDLYHGSVQWGLAPVVPVAWLFPIEAILLYLGAFGSLVAAFQIAGRPDAAGRAPHRAGVLRQWLPWAILCLLLLACGLWLMLQPMDMRGTLMAPGMPGG